jgi:hypothetical protein
MTGLTLPALPIQCFTYGHAMLLVSADTNADVSRHNKGPDACGGTRKVRDGT